VIEVAEASGLWRLRPDELNPKRATTYGTGELIAAALETGCRDFLIGLGGSATNDGGAGMAQALGYKLLDAQGRPLAPGGAALAGLDRIETDGVPESLRQSRFVAPTDVTNPLCGPNGASAVFGPQKGAGPADMAELDAALARFAEVVARDLGLDVRDMPGAGAAGGCGAGVIAFLGATVRSGAEAVAQATNLEARIQAADLVITGEGRLDGQTEFGKGPQYVARVCRTYRKPVLCVAGSLGPGYERLAPWFDVIESATRTPPEKLPSAEVATQQVGEAAVRGVLLLLAQAGRFGSA
jgi:glycerate kinase